MSTDTIGMIRTRSVPEMWLTSAAKATWPKTPDPVAPAAWATRSTSARIAGTESRTAGLVTSPLAYSTENWIVWPSVLTSCPVARYAS